MGAVLLVGAGLLCGFIYSLLIPGGLLENSSATNAIQQAHATDFIPRIDRFGAKKWLEHGTTFVDARFPSDYALGHLGDAINVPPITKAAERQELMTHTDKGSPVVVYCQSASCPYAESVAQGLMEDGFTNIRIYRGGWSDWKRSNTSDSQRTP
jgi:rhodanese-related sulfurtransferase